jgi:tetratricopeptide (TPR) repeat protein
MDCAITRLGDATSARSRNALWIAALLTAAATGHALPQEGSADLSVSPACAELNRRVLAHVANGQPAAAESELSTFLASGAARAQDACAGLVLNNMAALMSVSGRVSEAEKLAERSLNILAKIYPPGDRALLRPLQILASARFEQHKTAGARQAVNRMQSIRIERPEDRALVHGIAGALLEAEGRRPEAETEYLAAFHAWQEAGRENTADAGAVLNSLGLLYVTEHRPEEARRALDRALTTFSRARDAVPMDRINLLNVRGLLHARQGEWREAEQDFSGALALADREPSVNPVALRSLLDSYAGALRKNHHRREARAIAARAAGLPSDAAVPAVVDVADLLPKPKPAKK